LRRCINRCCSQFLVHSTLIHLKPLLLLYLLLL
jgi:hypothetical protein